MPDRLPEVANAILVKRWCACFCCLLRLSQFFIVLIKKKSFIQRCTLGSSYSPLCWDHLCQPSLISATVLDQQYVQTPLDSIAALLLNVLFPSRLFASSHVRCFDVHARARVCACASVCVHIWVLMCSCAVCTAQLSALAALPKRQSPTPQTH